MQALYIFLAMVLGILIHQAHELTFLVRYFVMIMLFYAFLRVDFRRDILDRSHLAVVLANVVLPLAFFFLFLPLGESTALAAFIIAYAPTAAGAPVIAGFLRQEVPFVTASVLLTSPVVAVVLPLVLPLVARVEVVISTMDVLGPVMALVFIPLLVSQLIRRHRKQWVPFFFRAGNVAFYLFLTNVFLASAKASHYIRFESEAPWRTLVSMAGVIGLVCLLQFKFGEWVIGRRRLPMESGMALGRKNTMFALWVALTFLSPLIALGPIFYILFQNAYNSWQLFLMKSEGVRRKAEIRT